MTINFFHHPARPSTNDSGFSLVELVIVVAIIAVLGTVAIQNFSPANARLKQAARELYGNLQRARMEAIKTNQDVGIVFDTANNQYFFCQDANSDNDCTDAGETILNTTCGDPANSINCAVDNTKLCCDLSSYGSGVQYAGALTILPVTGVGVCPSDGVSYTANIMNFTPTGRGSIGYVYLKNSQNSYYVAGTPSLAGVVMMKKWINNSWQ